MVNLKKYFLLVLTLVIISVPNLYADETSEAILKLLIKKGIITEQEVEKMKAELAKEKPAVPATLEARVTKLEESVPSWVKNMKMKGDLRLRHENIWKRHGESNERERIRFRWGVTTELNDKVNLGFGLGSGSSDTPTSTNQTLEQEFQSKNIWLDYAYASYDPYEWLHLIGGKFKSPFFHTDMLWDSDIRMDGFAGKLTHNLFEDSELPETKVYLTAGYFPLDDINNDEPGASDLFLNIFQTGTETKFDKIAKLKTGVTYYDFHNMEGYSTANLEEEQSTNTATGGMIANDFRVVSPIFKLTLKDPFTIGFPASLIGEYAENTAVSKDGSGWRLGLQLGEKTKEKGDWRFLWQYSRLEKDVFYDGFPDADFNSGGTNAKGWEIIFDYALWKNVILSLDYYNTRVVSGAKSDEQVLQTDVIFKF